MEGGGGANRLLVEGEGKQAASGEGGAYRLLVEGEWHPSC